MKTVSKSLMIVDDDLVFLEVLSRTMGKLGYQTITAHSISSAKDLLVQHYPDYAIVDLHLGGDNGIELVEVLTSFFPKTRTIILSGYANLPSVVSSMKAGAAECLPKPIDGEELDCVFRRMDGEEVALPEAWPLPDEIRRKHILTHLEKNDRNVSETARKLKMHRRTLQRILNRANI